MCINGHPEGDGARLKDGRCRGCLAAQRRRWYLRHKSEQNERTCQWRANNRRRHQALTRRWYEDNREKHLEKSRQWSADHPAAKAAARRRRRATQRGTSGLATGAQVEARIEYHGRRCVYCGGPFEEIDHAIPLSRGGSDWPANLVPSCRDCNRSKFTKTWKEFLLVEF